MAASVNPLPGTTDGKRKVPFNSGPSPKGFLPWYPIPFYFRQVTKWLGSVEKDVLLYLMEMQYGLAHAPSDPTPWCTEALAIESIAKECVCAKSAAQAALKLLVEAQIVEPVTPKQASDKGLRPANGTRTLRYTLLWKNFETISRESIDEARRRLVEQAPAKAKKEAAAGPGLVLMPGRHSTCFTLPDGRKTDIANKTKLPLSIYTEDAQDRFLFTITETASDIDIPAQRYLADNGAAPANGAGAVRDASNPHAHSKKLNGSQIPHQRYMAEPKFAAGTTPTAPAADRGDRQSHHPQARGESAAAVLSAYESKLRAGLAQAHAPIPDAGVRELAALLSGVDIDSFCATVQQRVETLKNQRKRITLPVLKLMAADAAELARHHQPSDQATAAETMHPKDAERLRRIERGADLLKKRREARERGEIVI